MVLNQIVSTHIVVHAGVMDRCHLTQLIVVHRIYWLVQNWVACVSYFTLDPLHFSLGNQIVRVGYHATTLPFDYVVLEQIRLATYPAIYIRQVKMLSYIFIS